MVDATSVGGACANVNAAGTVLPGSAVYPDRSEPSEGEITVVVTDGGIGIWRYR